MTAGGEMAITNARLFGLSEAEPKPERCGDVERARLREVEKHLRTIFAKLHLGDPGSRQPAG